ncbi:thiol reductant ABC exporter subunit CydC [Ancylobacter sp. TS-1]|uniref:thiol reductant ABC exporter subunit CydC n=1 Tax=Ancylobacter sp. TS-1 TaxID=1850374 RepID=UPI001265B260|nr:thiol reductant ABC exporter subunit CydC [Ancylobacter sp. TS-1]QFR32350.1 thiol reductant ABC exporter subunit CydC [Ancylobacter sp. TS-1]
MSDLRALGAVLRLFFNGRRGVLLAGIVLSALAIASGVALLGLAGWFITATAIAGASTATALAFDLFAPSAGIRFFALARTATRYAERLVTHDATLAVLAELRERLFRGWSVPGAAGRLVNRPTALLFRLTLDIDALDSLYLRVLVPTGAALAVTLGSAYALALVDPRLGLAFAVIVLLGGFGIPIWAVRAARRPARRRAHALEVLRSRAVDLVAGQVDLLMAGRLGARCDGLAEADARLAQADDALNRIEAGTGAAISVLGWLVLALAVIAVAALSEVRAVEPAIAALVLLVVLASLDPFGLLRRGAVELERALIAARRVAPRLASSGPAITVEPPSPGIAVRLEQVDLRPERAARPALIGLVLTVRTGERIALIGASGAGKSTLIAALAGEIGVAAGRLEALAATQLTQRTELFQDSLAENLRLASPDADDEELIAALDAAGLRDLLARLPDGLATRLGEGGLGLSGGQARRLALARLVLSDAPLWLLDEPTEGLDAATADQVMACLWARAGDRTVIIATHLEREAAGADRLVLLSQGRLERVVARGEPAFATVLAGLRAR